MSVSRAQITAINMKNFVKTSDNFLIIRLAETQDTDAVLRLAKDFATSFVVEDEIFRASFAALLADSSAYFAVTESEKGVVGYVLAFRHNAFYANGAVAWVEEIMVNASCRRRGIGKSLMRSAEVWAANQGCKLMALATRRAADFYEAIDYEASATYYRKLI